MYLEIITPETKIFNGEVEAVLLPGLDGLFQVLKGHAPIISGLTKGEVKVDLTFPFDSGKKISELIHVEGADSKIIRINIKGGVIELLNDRITVLAE